MTNCLVTDCISNGTDMTVRALITLRCENRQDTNGASMREKIHTTTRSAIHKRFAVNNSRITSSCDATQLLTALTEQFSTCGGGICATIAFLSLTDSAVKSCIASGDYSTVSLCLSLQLRRVNALQIHRTYTEASGATILYRHSRTVFGYELLAAACAPPYSRVLSPVVHVSQIGGGIRMFSDELVLTNSHVVDCIANGYLVTVRALASQFYNEHSASEILA
eukprot:6213311-Pleurochrysis_carterae.AAC.7